MIQLGRREDPNEWPLGADCDRKIAPPRKRHQAKAQFRAGTEELRARLVTAMSDEFQRELERSTQRIRDALAPYNRFVRSERDSTQLFHSNLQESLGDVERLRSRLRSM